MIASVNCLTFRCPTFLGFSSNWELKYKKYNIDKEQSINYIAKYTVHYLSIFHMSSRYCGPTQKK